MQKTLTLAEFRQAAAGIPSTADRRVIELRYDARDGWYKAVGLWEGVHIYASSPSFPALRAAIQRLYGLQLPRRNTLIFSRQSNMYRFAIIQACIPGTSCIVDCSAENRRASS
jgi:hypothetical protein